MKVAIIVPVYNAAKYIKQCFYSISAQTHKDIEAVFVDDCSTDDSKEILKKLIAKHSNKSAIKYTLIEHETNKNVCAARNSGIKHALDVKADYLSFIDSDDMLTPNCVETLLKLADKYPHAEIIQGGHISLLDSDFNRLLYDDMTDAQWEVIYKMVVFSKEFKQEIDVIGSIDDENGSNKYETVKFFLKNVRLYERIAMLGVWAALYKCDFLQKENILFSQDLPNTQDVYFRYLCFRQSRQTVITHIPVYFYRNVEGSLSKKEDQYQRINCWAICIEKMLPDADLHKEYMALLLQWCFVWAKHWASEIKSPKESALIPRFLEIFKKIKEKAEE